MKLVENELLVILQTLENNIPIDIEEGNLTQADLSKKIAAEIRWALVILSSVSVGPLDSFEDLKNW